MPREKSLSAGNHPEVTASEKSEGVQVQQVIQLPAVPQPQIQSPYVATPSPVSASAQQNNFDLSKILSPGLQLVVLLVAMAVAWGAQQTQITNLQETVQELKKDRISREVFSNKIEEQDRTNQRLESKIDKIDGLIRGLYEKLSDRRRPE